MMNGLKLDGNKLLLHLDRVNQWTRGEAIVPVYVAFSPTSYCNHHCIFCVYHYKEFKPIFFPLERYTALAREWAAAGVRSVFFAGDGDPLLHKDCDQMVRATKNAGIDVALNTNGRLLTPKNIPVFVEDLSFIRISVNAGTKESYGKIHGTRESDFDAVMENIARLVEEKKRRNSAITIGVQCVLLSSNMNEIHILAETVKKLGVDYLAVKPFLKHPDIAFDDNIPGIENLLEEYTRFGEKISDDKFSFVLRSHLFLDRFERNYKQCLSTDFMIEVDATGDVYSCGPHIGNVEHKLGNILKSDFLEFWHSENATKVKAHVRSVDVSKCMPSCRPDSVNRTLWEIRNPPQHINYI